MHRKVLFLAQPLSQKGKDSAENKAEKVRKGSRGKSFYKHRNKNKGILPIGDLYPKNATQNDRPSSSEVGRWPMIIIMMMINDDQFYIRELGGLHRREGWLFSVGIFS
jgi:hypothetical protein